LRSGEQLGEQSGEQSGEQLRKELREKLEPLFAQAIAPSAFEEGFEKPVEKIATLGKMNGTLASMESEDDDIANLTATKVTNISTFCQT
jgi:hypothetical protein